MGLLGGTQIETNKRNLVRNVIAWIAFNRTTDSNKIEVIVLDDQKSSKGNEKKGSYYYAGYSFLVTHPGTKPAKQGSTLLSG